MPNKSKPKRITLAELRALAKQAGCRIEKYRLDYLWDYMLMLGYSHPYHGFYKSEIGYRRAKALLLGISEMQKRGEWDDA